jgi:hypothetical protein
MAASTSSVKSSRRGAGNHDVRVPAEMIGCMEYDGSNPSAVRPGPANACRICCSTSLDPLAAHRFAVSSGTPVDSLRYAARSVRSATASRSG